MDEIRQTVLAYVTREDRLLVFEQPQYPEAGTQVPAGTVEDGEDPAAAVLREAHEETGIASLSIASFLATERFDFLADGVMMSEDRHFFHLLCGQEMPESWRYWETSPSVAPEGFTGSIDFDFRWVRLPGRVPELAGCQGSMLDRLTRKMGFADQSGPAQPPTDN